MIEIVHFVRELYNIPVAFCMQMTSCCQLYSVLCSFRDMSDFHPFKLVQSTELFPSPAFVAPLSQQSCRRLCELQAVSVVYWWTDIWERTKTMIKNVQFIFFFLRFFLPSFPILILSLLFSLIYLLIFFFISTFSFFLSIIECEGMGNKGTWRAQFINMRPLGEGAEIIESD